MMAVMVFGVKEEDKAVGRVGDDLARGACRACTENLHCSSYCTNRNFVASIDPEECTFLLI